MADEALVDHCVLQHHGCFVHDGTKVVDAANRIGESPVVLGKVRVVLRWAAISACWHSDASGLADWLRRPSR